MIRHTEIEDAILATFLYANEYDLNMDDVFKLNTTVFTTKYKQSVAKQINSVQNSFYGYLMTQLEAKTVGTAYEQDFINIIAQTPLTFIQAKKYYDELVKESRLRGAV